MTLAQAWVNGMSGDAVSVSTTGGTNNASISNTSTGGAGGNTTAGGTAVNLLVGDTLTLPAQTFTPPGAAANYTSTVSCNNSATPVSNAALPASFTVSASDTAITCTYTNTRKSATLTLSKVWAAGAVAGNATTLSTTGLVNNASTGASVATAVGNTTTGSAATVFAGETATFPAETLSPGQVANYSTQLACTGATASLSGSNGQASTLAIGAADAGQAISCSYTNTRNAVAGPDGSNQAPVFWQKADAMAQSYANGAPVTTWTNSAAGNDFVQDTAHSGTQPAFASAIDTRLNFNPTVSFDGTGRLKAPSALATSTVTAAHVFAVALPVGQSAGALVSEVASPSAPSTPMWPGTRAPTTSGGIWAAAPPAPPCPSRPAR